MCGGRNVISDTMGSGTVAGDIFQGIGSSLPVVVPAALAAMTGNVAGGLSGLSGAGAAGLETAPTVAELGGYGAGTTTAAVETPSLSMGALTGNAAAETTANSTSSMLGVPTNYSTAANFGGYEIPSMNMTTTNPYIASAETMGLNGGAAGGAGGGIASTLIGESSSSGKTFNPVTGEENPWTSGPRTSPFGSEPAEIQSAAETGAATTIGGESMNALAPWTPGYSITPEMGVVNTPSSNIANLSKTPDFLSMMKGNIPYLLAGNTLLGGVTNYMKSAKEKERMDEYLAKLQTAGQTALSNNVLTDEKINAAMSNLLGQQSTDRTAYLNKLSGTAAEAGRGGGSVASRLESYNRAARNTAAQNYTNLLSKKGTGADLATYAAAAGAGASPVAGATESTLSGLSSTLGNVPMWYLLSSMFAK